jgi:hypothetical protein
MKATEEKKEHKAITFLLPIVNVNLIQRRSLNLLLTSRHVYFFTPLFVKETNKPPSALADMREGSKAEII